MINIKLQYIYKVGFPNNINGYGSFHQGVVFGAEMLLLDSESRKTLTPHKAILQFFFNFQGMALGYHNPAAAMDFPWELTLHTVCLVTPL